MSTGKAARICGLAFSSDRGTLAFPDCNGWYGKKLFVLGGMEIGYPNNHSTRFYVNNGGQNMPHVGIRIQFPVRQNLEFASFSDDQGTPLENHSITVKLRAGTFTSFGRDLSPAELAALPPRTASDDDTLSVLRFTLKDGEMADVQDYGLPIVCDSPADQAILNSGAMIDGIMNLRDFCLQRRFEIIIPKYSTRLAAVNDQFRSIFPTEIQGTYPYANRYVTRARACSDRAC
jgi:hypothetical protein